MTGRQYLLFSLIFVVFVATGLLNPVERFIRSFTGQISTNILPDTNANEVVTDASDKELKNENELLKKELELNSEIEQKSVIATIVARSPDLLDKTITINKGTNDKIVEGNAVTTEGIVVGRVHSVRSSESVVLLIDDQDSRIDVEIGDNKRGVLKGGINGAYIDRVLPDVIVKKGELVVTGRSNISMPSGLPIGRSVSSLSTPDNSFQKIQFISPVDIETISTLRVIL